MRRVRGDQRERKRALLREEEDRLQRRLEVCVLGSIYGRELRALNCMYALRVNVHYST